MNCRDNPYLFPKHRVGEEKVIDMPYISRYTVNPFLKEFQLGDRKFRLASRRKAGTRGGKGVSALANY